MVVIRWKMDIYEEYLEGKKLDELLEEARIRREEGKVWMGKNLWRE